MIIKLFMLNLHAQVI